ncbi:ABC transporter ATP-binding protein [Desulfosoma caldarium]|uniref:Amino acid/amide ABC transporter ATP-binding protein 2 (HAAT family) n=1 Tax=Desulfosoma caldarium TaxID=610254 RepID=A0A3N1UHH4_9BACT|nr:ABC transporter ATP-binding protein [Desulfosoma caldarium]ROQ90715.1 amino acid/amide ABC transporter ATP-binding protein 2 (HAAT family) [Desulfosoma caldarium]
MIDVQDVHVYIGENKILQGLSLHMHAQETVAVVGANGAGKTTLIRTLMGLLKPAQGTVRVNGTDIAPLPPHEVVRLGLACVPEGRRVFKDLTVRENLEMGAYRKEARPFMAESMDHVTTMFPILRRRWHQRAGTLSGGEQQMLAIGRALMARPKILLIDELSLGLAPLIVKEIFEQLREIRRSMAVLLVEQNVEMTLKHSDRAYVMETGRITRQGLSAELLHDPKIREAYLGL